MVHNIYLNLTERYEMETMLPSTSNKEKESEIVSFVAEIARTGIYYGYQGDPEHKLTISKEDLINMVNNFQDKTLSNDLPIYIGHGVPNNFPGTEPPAVGWIRSLSIKENLPQAIIGKTWSLLAHIEMTEPFYNQYIESKSYQFTSIEAVLGSGIIHPVNGTNTGAILTGLALTNQPFIRGMKEISSSLSVFNPKKTFYCSFTNKGTKKYIFNQKNTAKIEKEEEDEINNLENKVKINKETVDMSVKKKTLAKKLEEENKMKEEETPSVELVVEENKISEDKVEGKDKEEEMVAENKESSLLSSENEIENKEEEILIEVMPPTESVSDEKPEQEEGEVEQISEEASSMDEKTKELLSLVKELLTKLMPVSENGKEDSSESNNMDNVESAIETVKKALKKETQMEALLSRAERAEALLESGKTISAAAMIDLAVRKNLLPITETDKYLKMFKEEPVKFSETFANLFDSSKNKQLDENNDSVKKYEKMFLEKLTLSNKKIVTEKKVLSPEINLTQVVTPTTKNKINSINKINDKKNSNTWEEIYLSRIKK